MRANIHHSDVGQTGAPLPCPPPRVGEEKGGGAFLAAALLAVASMVGCSSTNTDNDVDINNPPARSIRVTVTGEEFAQTGYAFPPSGDQEVVFSDGWEVRFTRVLATLGNITLASNPDRSASDQSQTGDVVARLDGAWAVNLTREGPFEEGATGLGVFTSQNAVANSPAFDPTVRYAFGYEVVPASATAEKVNWEASADADYQQMVANGETLLYVGTATFRGENCRNSQAGYDFNRLPRVVNFRLGFKAPTSYRNCLNTASGEEVRGVQVRENQSVDAMITLHIDHPFWDALEEDAPVRWDLIAARKSQASGVESVSITEEDLKNADFQAGVDAQGTAIPWRYCSAEPAANERTSGTIGYDPGSVPVNAAGGAQGLKDLYDFMTYNLSTFGHLNEDGLCFPERKYPSPL